VGIARRRVAGRIARVGCCRCSPRAHVGFAFSTGRSRGRATGSHVGIAAASRGAVGAGAQLGRTSTRIAAAARPRTTCITSVVGRPCRAGRTGNTASTGMGATRCAVRKCTPSASRRACSVMDRAAACG
jgi:hypothetical protein